MNQPCQTLYVCNLDEKIKIPNLKQSLRELFSQFGNIIDVVAHKNIRLRGQAFVVFDQIDSAVNAQKNLRNHELFGKPMVVQFAKTKSDATVLNESPEEYEQHKQKRLPLKEAKNALIKQAREKSLKKRKSIEPGDKRVAKRIKEDIKLPELPPHKILFVENLPDGIQQDALVQIFEKFAGFVEVRLFAVRHLGFVEYENDEQAIEAKNGTVGLELQGNKLKITFAKK